jgi:excisionase family DNA binding protein
MPEKQFLTVQQFAASLGCTVACVRRWVLERKVSYVKVGRLVRIPVGELDRLIREGERPARTWEGGRR